MKKTKTRVRMIRASDGCINEIERVHALLVENAELTGASPEQIERVSKDTHSLTIRLACMNWAERLERENAKLRNA